MLVGVVGIVVDAEHEGDVGVRCRGRDNNLGSARLEVKARLVAAREDAGRLEHNVDAELAPWQLRGIALVEELELFPRGLDRAVGGRDVAVESPEHRVVLEEMRHLVGVTEVVDRDQVDINPLAQ